jgi:alpha-galactosidase
MPPMAFHDSGNQTAPSDQSWTLWGRRHRYVIGLRASAVICDCYPTDTFAIDESASPSHAAGEAVADAALLVIGPTRRPVTWRVAAWHQPNSSAVQIALSADRLPLAADVSFAIDDMTGILVRRTLIRHQGTGPDVDITGTLGLWYRTHEPVEHMCHLAGAWAHETQIRRGRCNEPLVLESRAGKTGFSFQPYVALEGGSSTYVCEIAWSGNWTLRVVPCDDGAVLHGGLNNWGFGHRLRPGGSLPLPDVLFGRFEGDLNTATQRLHDYRRARRPDPDRIVPVQFNSWYAYFGEPTAGALLAQVPLVQRLGCEAFVIDAGWYETDDGVSAGDWAARTGDWRTSRARFPNGLQEISSKCREHGLRFGLWFEPEVIGPLATVRRDHPEWLHHIGGRPPRADERAVLQLGIPAARRHVCERITRVLSSSDVGWMKWDFNTDLGAGGWAPGLARALTDQDPLVAHYAGVYELQNEIRRRFPDLILEMCASGGGRMHAQLLSHAHVNWISDQPGPLRKLAIHVGSQLAHPAVDCNDWLVEWPPRSIDGYDGGAAGVDRRGDLAFRLRVAMLGSFGLSAHIDRWPEADLAVAAAHIALYREKLRPIIHDGDQYHLTPPPPPDGNGDWVAM